MSHNVLIQSVSCNSRDCPWYRRGSKCRHPSAVDKDIAEHNMERVPVLCPLHQESCLLMVDRNSANVNVAKRRMERVIQGIKFWLNLMNKYGSKRSGAKKGESHVRRQVHGN